MRRLVVWPAAQQAVGLFRDAVESGDLRLAVTALRHAERLLDMAVAKREIGVRTVSLIKCAMREIPERSI
jgi:repressor of nif and glnA expression